MTNVSSMPTDWLAWSGDIPEPLGICEDFDEACEKADKLPYPVHWVFSRESLVAFVEDAQKELTR